MTPGCPKSEPPLRCVVRSIPDTAFHFVLDKQISSTGAMSRQPLSEIVDVRTVDAARTLLRTFFNIADAWQLKTGEQERLLGVNESVFTAWRNGAVASPLSDDTLRRVGYVVNIYAALQILLPSGERANAWVHTPNTAERFGGEPALTRMLGGRVDDLKLVSEYLDAMRRLRAED